MSYNKEKISMDDFEKGLMLLGLVSPLDAAELLEIEAVNQYEKDTSKERQQLHFRRVVLAAEIVSKLHNEPTFGRIKFQKLVYMCEHVADMELYHRYVKQAAGPFDNKFMHSIHKEFKKLKWFDVQLVRESNIARTKYVLLGKADGYITYYNNYFKDYHDRIQYVIQLFKNKKTDDTELAATVFACYLELRDTQIKKDALLNLFYSWSDKKKRFTETQVLNSFQWLSEHQLIPEITITE